MKQTWLQPAVHEESTPSGGMTAEAPLLRRYLREMGATPLLDPREEARLAVRLRDARLAIAELAKALPERCRAIALEGDPSGPESGAAWPLGRLERFLRELERHASLRPDARVVASLRARSGGSSVLADGTPGERSPKTSGRRGFGSAPHDRACLTDPVDEPPWLDWLHLKQLGFRVGAGISGACVIALLLSTALLAGEAGADDPATRAALRAFEERISRLHARQIARTEARGRPSEPPIEKPPPLPPPPRSRLRSVLDRMSISTRWQVEQDSWSAGIRLRYSRSVEFDPASRSYALVEAGEITPAARYEIVALARATKVLVRRTGYGTWEDALFETPSRWLFVDRPNRVVEALRLAPGTTVTASNETALFLGADGSTDLGEFPLRFRAGIVASGESFARLERLAENVETSDGREWIVSSGGLVARGFDTAMNLRTPDIVWGKNLRLLEAHWRSSRGVRFLVRAGPLDLRANPETAEFLETAMAGAAPFRFLDVPLLGANLKATGRHPEIGPDLLERMERFPNFGRLVAAAAADPDGIPFTESVSRFTPRAHGESGVGVWAFLYGLNLTSDWYAEESVAAPSRQPLSKIFTYPLQRRWDRGWLFFPRETQDLQMLTVEDGQGEDVLTEVSWEIEDARAHRRESRVYREQVLRFMTRDLAERFPQRSDWGSAEGPGEFPGELPDLVHPPEDDERVSIYLRIILGPRFHERLLLGAKDAKDRRDRITEWQKRLARTIRRRGDAVEELVRTYGVQDLFVSYRIALTPYARRKESPRPTTLYTGSHGDPDRIPSYRRLRNLFDAAGTIF